MTGLAPFRIAAVFAVAFAVAVAAPLSSAGPAEPLEVFVSIPPQKYIVEKVGGSRVKVAFLVTPGRQPHIFEPTPRQIAALSRARIYFTVGIPFEARLAEKIRKSHGLEIVDMSANVEDKRAAAHDHKDDSHESAASELTDPHVWLSPAHLKTLAANARDALAAADAAGAKDYEANYAAFVLEIDQLHSRLAAKLKPHSGKTFFVFHPAFGHFAKAYGLRQRAVEAGGKSPTPRALLQLITTAREQGAKVIFVQPQFDPKSAEMIAKAVGAEVVALDPLAEDVLENLKTMAEAVAQALSD